MKLAKEINGKYYNVNINGLNLSNKYLFNSLLLLDEKNIDHIFNENIDINLITYRNKMEIPNNLFNFSLSINSDFENHLKSKNILIKLNKNNKLSELLINNESILYYIDGQFKLSFIKCNSLEESLNNTIPLNDFCDLKEFFAYILINKISTQINNLNKHNYIDFSIELHMKAYNIFKKIGEDNFAHISKLLGFNYFSKEYECFLKKLEEDLNQEFKEKLIVLTEKEFNKKDNSNKRKM